MNFIENGTRLQAAVTAVTHYLKTPDHPIVQTNNHIHSGPNAYGIPPTQIEILTKVNTPQMRTQYERNNIFRHRSNGGSRKDY